MDVMCYRREIHFRCSIECSLSSSSASYWNMRFVIAQAAVFVSKSSLPWTMPSQTAAAINNWSLYSFLLSLVRFQFTNEWNHRKSWTNEFYTALPTSLAQLTFSDCSSAGLNSIRAGLNHQEALLNSLATMATYNNGDGTLIKYAIDRINLV